jgi:diguanylate cyclase (GGDEF)-like protein/PAS domain S-box-containing protein
VLVVGGFALYYLYLRRVLEHLDPSAVIPERVRSAFDILAEGVLIVDLKGRIVLANQAFRSLHPEARSKMLGKHIAALPWLMAKLPGEADTHPWAQAIQQKAPVSGVALEIVQEEAEPRQVILNCSPVLDGRREVRGCLVTFDDVTALEKANQMLLATLGELEASRTRIELQNEELKKLASHDSLTGCLNRRAFFERAQVLFDEARQSGGEFSVIMADIDHFKAVNDTHGHVAGDRAIQHFAKLLLTSLRGADLLCRYGGEEFCVALPGASLKVALAVAERIRAKIEAECGPGVRCVPDLRVTSSVGVSSIDLGAANIPALVDQADQALYVAKKTGRNRVNSYAKIAERSHQPVAAALHCAALQDARSRRQQRAG